MCRVEPDETALLGRLTLVSRDFNEVFAPILFSGIALNSNSSYDLLFDALSSPTRGRLLLRELQSLRLVNVAVPYAARLLMLVGSQLVDIQLAVAEDMDEPESERIRQRGRLIDGLSRCRKLERFAVRQNIIKPRQLATLLALWPRLHHFDFEGELPNIAAAEIKPVLLPRLKTILLHSPVGRTESFLRYFGSPLTHYELHGTGELGIDEFHYKRLRTLSIDANGPVRPAHVVEMLRNNRAPVLREVQIVGGLGKWRKSDLLSDFLHICREKDVVVASVGS